MTEVERFFRQLVHNLAEIDLRRVQQPVSIEEIRGSIVPYRANRRALELDTSEDYELALMRLCAGEGGFASVSPEEVGTRFEQELAGPNPDLTVLRQFGDALVSLAPSRIFSVLSEPMPKPASTSASAAVGESPQSIAVRCIACGEALPGGRPANFCPYCGRSQQPPSCSACGLELKSGWRFCPACGQGT